LGINSRKWSNDKNVIIDIFEIIFRAGSEGSSSSSVCKMIAPHFHRLYGRIRDRLFRMPRDPLEAEVKSV